MSKKWNHTEIEILKKNRCKKLTSEMAELLPGRSNEAILSKAKRLGLALESDELHRRCKLGRSLVKKTNYKTDQDIRWENLDYFTKQLLMGSMLGDGCCNKQTANMSNFRFCESHSLAQADYNVWKCKKLKIFKPKCYIRSKNARSDLITLTHPIFSKLRQQFYSPEIQPKSLIPIELLANLDLFGLMIWFLDDGHLRSNKYLEISAKGWNPDGLTELVKLINQKHGTGAYIYRCRHKNGFNQVVKFPAKNTMLLLEKWNTMALRHKLPFCMFYKLNIQEVHHSN